MRTHQIRFAKIAFFFQMAKEKNQNTTILIYSAAFYLFIPRTASHIQPATWSPVLLRAKISEIPFSAHENKHRITADYQDNAQLIKAKTIQLRRQEKLSKNVSRCSNAI